MWLYQACSRQWQLELPQRSQFYSVLCRNLSLTYVPMLEFSCAKPKHRHSRGVLRPMPLTPVSAIGQTVKELIRDRFVS